MSQRWIVVDVDGVLNSSAPTPHSFRTTATAEGRTFRMKLDKRHATWLTELAEQTGATLIWGTTWQGDASGQIGAQIGLPEMPWCELDPALRRTLPNGEWKARGVLARMAGDPFVWLDDDITIARHIEGSGGHLVHVDCDAGLSEGDVGHARDILQRMSTSAQEVTSA